MHIRRLNNTYVQSYSTSMLLYYLYEHVTHYMNDIIINNKHEAMCIPYYNTHPISKRYERNVYTYDIILIQYKSKSIKMKALV